MFFKKNKPTPPPEAEHQAAIKDSTSSGQSLFAPSLNPTPAQVDFGFNKFSNNQFDDNHQFDENYLNTPPPLPGAPAPWQPEPWIPPATPEPWIPPAAPEPEDWIGPDNPSQVASSIAPYEPAPEWEAPVPPVQLSPSPAPLPPAMETPVSELTPEQAWSMLEPAPSNMPVVPESEEWSFESSAPSYGELSPPSMGAEKPQQDAAQADWASAFEAPDFSTPSAPEASTQFAVPSFESEYVPAPLPESISTESEQSWDYSPDLNANFNAEAPVQPITHEFEAPGFEAAVAPSWDSALPEADRSTPSPIVEPTWSDAAYTPQAFEPIEPMESTEPALAWEIPAPPVAPEPAPTAIPEAYLEYPELPSFSPEPTAIPAPHSISEFDPMKASQELATGWSQLESVAPEAPAPLMPVDPLAAAWADENMPPPVSPQAPAAEWASFTSEATEPIYMHETAPTIHSEESLWNNLSTPESVAPGEQVPLAAGAFMDAINQQLYPEDPFSGVNDEFAAGEQAFAEAAQYLFPETMSAPLEWGDDSGYGASDEEEDPDGDETGTVIDLGPSYMPQSQGFAQLSNEYANEPPSGYAHEFQSPSGVSPEAFSGVVPYEEELGSSSGMSLGAIGGYYISAEQEFTPSPYATDESLDDFSTPLADTASFGGGQAVSLEPIREIGDTFDTAWQTPVIEPPRMDIQPAMLQQTPIEPAPMPSTEWGYVPLPDSGVTAPAAELSTPRLEQSWYSEDVLGASVAPQDLPDMLASSWTPQPMETAWRSEELSLPQSLVTSELELESQMQQAAFAPSTGAPESDEDFYATAYTLNEQGELVPIHDEDLFPQLEPLAPQPQYLEYQPEPALLPEMVSSPPPVDISPIQLEEVATSNWAQPTSDRSFPQPAPPEWVAPAPAYAENQLPQPAYGEEVPGMIGLDALAQPLPLAQFASPPIPEMPPAPEVSQRSVELTQAPVMPSVVEAPAAWPGLAPLPLAPQEAMTPPSYQPAPQMLPPVPSRPQSSSQSLIQPEFQAAPKLEPPQFDTHLQPPAFEQHVVPQSAPPAEEAIPPEKRIIHPKPLTRKMPSQTPSADLETQWYSPEEPAMQAETLPHSTKQAAMAVKLTLGNLEVMGLCQLSNDRRLLVVHNAGVYALMAQNGQEQSEVNVLKVFEQNPLAYQHTFTAVEEGQAAGQGMYVTQVGTWHAIISTFQDKITLHTELG